VVAVSVVGAGHLLRICAKQLMPEPVLRRLAWPRRLLLMRVAIRRSAPRARWYG